MLHLQRINEFQRFVGVNRAETVGLAPVAGDFGKKLVVGDAGTGDEVQFFADRPFNVAGHINGKGNSPFVVGDIQKSFVNADGFDEIGIALKN